MKLANIKNYLNEKITNSWYKIVKLIMEFLGSFLTVKQSEMI